MFPREANRKSQELFPFEKMSAKHGGIPMHPNFFINMCQRDKFFSHKVTTRAQNYLFLAVAETLRETADNLTNSSSRDTQQEN